MNLRFFFNSGKQHNLITGDNNKKKTSQCKNFQIFEFGFKEAAISNNKFIIKAVKSNSLVTVFFPKSTGKIQGFFAIEKQRKISVFGDF